MIKLGFAMVMAAAAVGCSGDDDGGGAGGTGPVTMAKAQELCQSSCEYAETCGSLDTAGGETVATCTDECVADIGGGGYRTDVVEDIFACQEALACDASDDACFMCTPTPTHEAYETACRAKLPECGVAQEDIDQACETTPDPTASGDTGFLCVVTPEAIDAFKACLDMDCTAIQNCFQMVATQYGIDD